jgi:hypothetical protein
MDSDGDVEGTDELSDTLLGSITPVVGPEREYEDGGTICRTSSGKEPDLGVLENPWIEDATMEWSNHAIALRASAEVVTHSLDDPREGEGAPDVQVGVERCDVGAIGAVGLLRDLDGPERDSVVCEVLPLVPHFEEEENYRYEMTNLPVAEGPLAPNCLPDYALKLLHENVPESPSSVEAVSVGFAKGLSAGNERCVAWVVFVDRSNVPEWIPTTFSNRPRFSCRSPPEENCAEDEIDIRASMWHGKS